MTAESTAIDGPIKAALKARTRRLSQRAQKKVANMDTKAEVQQKKVNDSILEV